MQKGGAAASRHGRCRLRRPELRCRTRSPVLWCVLQTGGRPVINRQKRSHLAGWTLAVLLVSLSSCDKHPVQAGPQKEVAAVGHPSLRTAGGLILDIAKVQRVYNDLTRDVALALQDPTVRSVVYRALHASPYPEHKLHFRSFLSGDGRPVRARLAAVRHVAPEGLFGTLDSLVDLEFYMPVKEHWTRWDGSANLLVVNDLSDDDDVLPALFDLAGNSVGPVSEHVPPTTPTLSLVPVETDFSTPPAIPPRAQQVATDAGPGVYMTYSNINDLHEPWPSGAPEIEVHAFVRNPAGNFVDVQCAGEHQADPFRFDQNDPLWSSSDSAAVEVVPEGGVGTNPIEISLWEDDDTACDPGSGRPPITIQSNRDQFTSWGPRLVVSVSLENGVKVLRPAELGVPLILGTNDVGPDVDDELGEATVPSCWMSPNWRETFPLHMSDAGHPSNGQIELDFRFGQRQPACQQSLTVYLDGPNSGSPYTNVTISASPSNYVLPVHYAWTVNGAPACGDQNTCTASLGAAESYTAFAITVTDGSGSQASASHAVYACPPRPVSDMKTSNHSMSSAAPCY
jgi:hypothetical protein